MAKGSVDRSACAAVQPCPFVGAERLTEGHRVGARPPTVPADVAAASRAVTGWRLDKDRPVTAVAHFAPEIPVRDLS